MRTPLTPPHRIDLGEAFSQTDRISYGCFLISKPPGVRFEYASFFVKGIEVNITNRQKEIMALLISQQGHPLTHDIMRNSLYFMKIKDDNKRLIKVHVSNIRKAIREQLSGKFSPEEINQITGCIYSVGLNKKAGQTGQETGKNIGSYKLMMNFE